MHELEFYYDENGKSKIVDWKDNKFILLHYFIKKIQKAQNILKNFLERKNNEH
jgi:phage-related protein